MMKQAATVATCNSDSKQLIILQQNDPSTITLAHAFGFPLTIWIGDVNSVKEDIQFSESLSNQAKAF